jgi:8-oxo-dGTP diphosphatase
LQQVHTFGKVNRHPSGRVVTTAYYSLININSHKLKIIDNDLNWHSVKNIRKLAFDHKEILETCLAHLQQEVMETPVVHNLMPEKFSLRELQEVYEAILASPLDRRNFRKKIAVKQWLQDLNEMEDNVSHRPGKLYKFKPKYLKNGFSRKS